MAPVMGDLTLPLDSILHYLVHREAYGSEEFTTPGAPTVVDGCKDTSLPLARVDEHGPMWFYAASFAQWGDYYVDGGDHWSRRFAMGRVKYLDERKVSVDIASGRFKSYRMPVFYRHALEIHWYAVGLQRRIAELLPHMTHIGKKTSQGWGAVTEWRVEKVPEDFSVYGPRGELMRAVPAEGGILSGFRPSYWYSKNQAPCRIPQVAGDRSI
jgi:CRISPR type IV-associated protein Csf3